MAAEPRTVLIVDDEPVIARGLAALLGRRGFNVLTALSGSAARDILSHRHVDGILIDYRVADLRGDVLLASAVAIQPHLRTRAVFLTGDISETARDVLAETGCPVVMKPFETEDLVRVLNEVMSEPRQSQQGSA
jgi:DNA-binding NtrC family response regulator